MDNLEALDDHFAPLPGRTLEDFVCGFRQTRATGES